jgi:hypothetical protein
VYGSKREWDRKLEAARLAGLGIEKAVREAIAKQQQNNPEMIPEIDEKPIVLVA